MDSSKKIKKDITGQKFGYLTVTKFVGNIPISTPGKRRGLWQCKCDCGNDTAVFTGALIGNKTRSCGCNGKRNDKGERLCAKCKLFVPLTSFSSTNSYCDSCTSKVQKASYNKERASEKFKKAYPKHREKRLTYAKKYRLANLEKVQENLKKWKLANPNYKKDKWKSDINFRIKENLRGRFYKAVKSNSKSKSVTKLVGCTIQELRDHLSKLFLVDMTWDNYGKWHIDHKKPCSKFDLSKPEEQQKCFHYSNLQPLWAIDNLIKSNKI